MQLKFTSVLNRKNVWQRPHQFYYVISIMAVVFVWLMIWLSPDDVTAQQQDIQNVIAKQSSVETAISYQGQMSDGGQPANGKYDFEFRLYDAFSGGKQIGNTATKDAVAVTDGLFSVQLDFGNSAFVGNQRFIAISVRPSGSSNLYTELAPRQELVPVPYAAYATHALGLSAADGDPKDVVNVDQEGRVGISTLNPGFELVVHDLNSNDDPLGGGALLVESSTGQSAVMGADVNNPWMGSLTNHDLRIVTNDVEKMRVTKDGRVGIGTTNPSAEFVVHDLSSNDDPLGGGALIIESSTGQSAVMGADANNPWMGSLTNHDLRIVTNDVEKMRVTSDGRIGIGTTNPQAKLEVVGTTSTKILQINGGADLAESFAITGKEPSTPGFVVSIDAEHIGQLRIADSAYDRTVAGIVSGAGGINPGMVMQQQGTLAEGEYPVSVVGRVYAWADASYNAIEPGDLLTTSPTPGHIMKVVDYDKAQGAIIGKAISGLQQGKGLILILVALQ